MPSRGLGPWWWPSCDWLRGVEWKWQVADGIGPVRAIRGRGSGNSPVRPGAIRRKCGRAGGIGVDRPITGVSFGPRAAPGGRLAGTRSGLPVRPVDRSRGAWSWRRPRRLGQEIHGRFGSPAPVWMARIKGVMRAIADPSKAGWQRRNGRDTQSVSACYGMPIISQVSRSPPPRRLHRKPQ